MCILRQTIELFMETLDLRLILLLDKLEMFHFLLIGPNQPYYL